MIGAFVQYNVDSVRGNSQPVGYLIQENGCWEWVGCINKKGYGQLRAAGKTRLAHRFYYEQTNGPAGPELDHLCRNRSCVNPAHLEPVSHLTNIRRGNEATKAHCIRGHPLSGENLYLRPGTSGWRMCRACMKIRGGR
jgi:hypothetical protein